MDVNNIFATPEPQKFSLPYFIIQHVLKHSSAITLQKLNQSCKYFYSKNRVAVWINFNYGILNSCNQIFQQSKDKKMKLWIHSNTCLIVTVPEGIIPRIYRCQVEQISFSSNSVKFDDFLLLTETVKICRMYSTNIYYSEDEIAPLEDIMASIPQIENFLFCQHPFKSIPFQKLSTIKPLKNLRNLVLTQLPVNFNNECLVDFLKKHPFCSGRIIFENLLDTATIENINANTAWKCYQNYSGSLHFISKS